MASLDGSANESGKLRFHGTVSQEPSNPLSPCDKGKEGSLLRMVGWEPSYGLSFHTYAGLMFMMGIKKHIHQLGG